MLSHSRVWITAAVSEVLSLVHTTESKDKVIAASLVKLNKTHTQFYQRNYQTKSKNSISYFLLRAKVIAACDILGCKVSERVWHASLLNINMDGQNTFICEISEESYKLQIKF